MAREPATSPPPAMLRGAREETTAAFPPIAEHRETMVNNGEFAAIDTFRTDAYRHKSFVHSEL